MADETKSAPKARKRRASTKAAPIAVGEPSENTVSSSRSRVKEDASTDLLADAFVESRYATRGLDASSAAPSQSKDNKTTLSDIPAAVRDRFLNSGSDYFFPDGAPAFRDRGGSLTTRSENAEVIRTLLHIAQARGWQTVRVAGSEKFRRLAWEVGGAAGVTVRGYSPRPGERARNADRPKTADTRASRGEQSAGPLRADPSAVAEQVMPSAVRSDPLDKPPLIQGELLAHGRAPYNFQSDNQESYFIRLKTGDGERTVWGKDLERALAESSTHPIVGDSVGLQPRGRDRVTVPAKNQDASGDAAEERSLNAYRNRWTVERMELFEARAGAVRTLRDPSISANTGVERYPELADAYLHVRAAESFARQKINREVDRERFVALVRDAIASATGRGESLLPATLRHGRSATHLSTREGQGPQQAEPALSRQ
jgi:conjugative element/phage-associated large polyvalent protein